MKRSGAISCWRCTHFSCYQSSDGSLRLHALLIKRRASSLYAAHFLFFAWQLWPIRTGNRWTDDISEPLNKRRALSWYVDISPVEPRILLMISVDDNFVDIYCWYLHIVEGLQLTSSPVELIRWPEVIAHSVEPCWLFTLIPYVDEIVDFSLNTYLCWIYLVDFYYQLLTIFLYEGHWLLHWPPV